MLECGDGTIYTGITDDLERRLRAHSRGQGAKYTRGRGPLKLRYQETVPDKSTALKREFALKRLRKADKLAIIAESNCSVALWKPGQKYAVVKMPNLLHAR